MSEKSEKLLCNPKCNKHDEVCSEMTQIYTFLLFYIAKTRISTKLKRTVFWGPLHFGSHNDFSNFSEISNTA